MAVLKSVRAKYGITKLRSLLQGILRAKPKLFATEEDLLQIVTEIFVLEHGCSCVYSKRVAQLLIIKDTKASLKPHYIEVSHGQVVQHVLVAFLVHVVVPIRGNCLLPFLLPDDLLALQLLGSHVKTLG